MAVAASAIAQQVGGNVIALPHIDPTQGMRIISLAALLFDQDGIHQLTALRFNANLLLSNLSNTQIRVIRCWESQGSNASFLGQQGMRVGVSYPEEPIYGTDFTEVAQSIGAAPGMFLVQTGADITNGVALAKNVTFSTTVQIEIFQRPIPPS